MHAMLFTGAGKPLDSVEVETPQPSPTQVLVKVDACGVCRTDLHVVDGELPDPKLPLIPGHEVVGHAVAVGSEVADIRVGDLVGIPWLGWTCGICSHCRAGRENLCENAKFTGYTLDGGYAEYAVADHRYCFPIGGGYSPPNAAPLLCAGLIGYRSYEFAGEARTLGLYGFGAAAHLLAQVAKAQGRKVFAFTKPSDTQGQAFARQCGADWAGGSDEAPPEPLDAAILFAPVGALVPQALAAVKKGGRVVCGGIHMSDIPSFPYALLWGERGLQSVANLTRADGEAFMRVAGEAPLRSATRSYPLEQANQALADLREGRLEGAAVLLP